jgi:hypothetical protein
VRHNLAALIRKALHIFSGCFFFGAILMNKFFWASAFFALLAIISLVGFMLIGSYVDEQGYMHEPLFLAPIGMISLAASGVCFFVGLASKG